VFHSIGPETVKPLCPCHVVLEQGTARSPCIIGVSVVIVLMGSGGGGCNGGSGDMMVIRCDMECVIYTAEI